jgi:hypothetical protein
MVQESTGRLGRTMTRVGIAGAIALGAVASGLLLSRSGRRLLGEVWEGRQRTTIEDRVLDSLWRDPLVGRRRIEVIEIDEGIVRLLGAVHTEAELDRVSEIVTRLKGVRGIENELQIAPPARRTRRASV